MSKSRGFVLGEIVAGLALVATLAVSYELASDVWPPLKSLCVGAGGTPETAKQSRMLDDAKRWACVPVTMIEDAEYRFVGASRRAP